MGAILANCQFGLIFGGDVNYNVNIILLVLDQEITNGAQQIVLR